MKAISLSPQSEKQIGALDQLYRQSKDGRLRQRAQIILLAAEQGMRAPQIAKIVRLNEESVRRWLKRYEAEGIEGLKDNPRSGATPIVTEEYREKLVSSVRRRPRSLEQPFSLWTCQRLADYMAEETGIRVSDETVRRYLEVEGIVLSRPQHKISSPDPDYEVKKRRLRIPAIT
ncbi:MAG: helix-turn-helix domain-containing protein [Chloroflexota bacterium]